MTDRPTCVLLPEESALTWCDRQIDLSEFAFTSIDHAALNGKHKGRLVTCAGCLRVIHFALTRGVTHD